MAEVEPTNWGLRAVKALGIWLVNGLKPGERGRVLGGGVRGPGRGAVVVPTAGIVPGIVPVPMPGIVAIPGSNNVSCRPRPTSRPRIRVLKRWRAPNARSYALTNLGVVLVWVGSVMRGTVPVVVRGCWIGGVVVARPGAVAGGGWAVAGGGSVVRVDGGALIGPVVGNVGTLVAAAPRRFVCDGRDGSARVAAAPRRPTRKIFLRRHASSNFRNSR